MTVEEAIEDGIKRAYQRGVLDGMEAELNLLLGRSVEGSVPYEGPLNTAAWEWATRRLTGVQETQRQQRGEARE